MSDFGAQYAIPRIAVKDIAASIEYYKKLGFKALTTPSEFAAMHGHIFLGDSYQTSTTHVMLCPESADGLGRKSDLKFQLKTCDHVDKVYEFGHKHGAKVHETPESKPWDWRETSFYDLDGKVLVDAIDYASPRIEH